MVVSADESPARLGGRASRGAATTMAGQIARIGIQLVGIVVLARLLSPIDYGLTAAVLAVIGVGEMVRDFGLGLAALQAKTLSRQQKDNLFWANTAMGLIIGVLAFLSSWGIGALYGDDRVVAIAQFLSVTFLLNGLSSQFRVELERNLRFLALILADVTALAVGVAAGILIATGGYGYWAIVGQQLVQVTCGLVFVVIASRWWPGRYHRSTSIASFVRFGGNLVASQLLEYASKNTDSVVIGAQFGAVPLGLYNRAFQLLTVPLNQLGWPATRVAVPVLSRLHDDEARYRRYLLTGQTALLQLILFIFGAMCALAEPAVRLVLGPQWVDSAGLFRILAIAGVFQAASYATSWVFLSQGLTRSNLRFNLVLRPVIIVLIIAGSFFGVEGVAWGYALGTAISWPLALLWIGRISDAPVGAMFLGGLRAMVVYGVAAAAAFGVSRLVDEQADVVRCAAGVGTMVAVVLLAVLVWRTFREDIRLIIASLRALRKA